MHALAEIHLHGPLRLLEPFMGRAMDREFSTREPAIKRALEGASAGEFVPASNA